MHEDAEPGPLPNLSTVHLLGQPALDHIKEQTKEENDPPSSEGPATPPHSPLRAIERSSSSYNEEEHTLDGSTPKASVAASAKFTFAALLVVVTCINSTFSLMAPIFPQEADKRHIQPTVTGLIFSIYSFTNFFVSPLHGHCMQRRIIKRKFMLLLGLGFSAFACLGLALSVYIKIEQRALFSVVCLLLRVVNGIGAAAVDTSSMAICSEMFKDLPYFGTLIGVLESCLAVGWMVGPLLGGYLAALGGFSAPFYAAAIIGALMIPIPLLMRDTQAVMAKDAHHAAELTHWTLLRKVEISLFMLVTILAAAAVTFCDSVLAPFLQGKLGFSEGTVGVCFAVIAMSYAVSTTIAGWASDRTSPVAVITAGLLVSVIPFALLGPSPFLAPLLAKAHLGGTWHVWASFVFLGSGCAMCLMPVLPATLIAAEKESLAQSGVEDLASGLIAGAYYLGGGAGPIIGGAATALIGFEWASTAYGIGLLLLSSILAITLLVHKRQNTRNEELSEPLLNDV